MEENWSFSPCTMQDTQTDPSGTEETEQGTSAASPSLAPPDPKNSATSLPSVLYTLIE